MWVNVHTHARGWHTVHKKCELVPGGNSLDAEIWGCAMMIESMKKWVVKMCVLMNVSLRTVHFFGGTHCTRVCVVTEPYTPEPFCEGLVARVCDARWCWDVGRALRVGCSVCRTTHAVAETSSSHW